MLPAFRFFLTSLILALFTFSFAQADTKKQERLKVKISVASSKLGEARAFSESIRGELERNEAEINRLSRKQYQTERKIDSITRQLMDSGERKRQAAAGDVYLR